VDQRFAQGGVVADAETVQFFDPMTGAPLADLSAAVNQQMSVGSPPPERGLTYLESDAAVTLASSRVVSVLNRTVYGSPQRVTFAEGYEAVIWDVGQRRVVKPEELFTGDGLESWSSVRGALLDALAAHFNGEVDRAELERLDLGAPSDHAVALTPRGLQVSFNKCEILSCADGAATIEIPYAGLQTVLKPEWLVDLTQPWSTAALGELAGF